VTEPPEAAGAGRERRPVVELDGPLSQTAWSPDFVVQSIEGLFAYLGDDGIHSLRPIHADSLWLGLRPGSNPADVVIGAAARYGLRPIVVHSTSWRQADARVVLTYVAVIEPPASASPHLVDAPVSRSDLARGDATAAPVAIGVSQVLEHALRHLAWLIRDDAAVSAALPGWREPLREYVPEPFRGL
jgi:hypothetical protein